MSKNISAKRVNIVSLKMVKEGSILYNIRHLSRPADAAGLGRQFLENLDREQVLVCCLDNKNQPVSINVVSIGTINSAVVHPREIFKTAVLSNAASIILFHNHPSGDPKPSQEDIDISKRIKDAGEILGIELLDHIIIGSNESYYSLKEKNHF
ncbi:JAB domain-containing protein [Eubacteriaceae bacterium ES2]|nr:JAB domain-containing protein [Eubacteriaceae bacterium ES2]